MTYLLLFVIAASPLASSVSPPKIVIDYEYNGVGICIGATARFVNGEPAFVIGRAALEEIVKNKHYRVRLKHYSKSGDLIYEAVATYSLELGTKLSEEKVQGRKRIEIFETWPSGM